MKIINLIEDSRGENSCINEHGLSFYIECRGKKILLDTGASNAFMKNAQQSDIDLTKIDIVVISHGHYDHAGGLLAFANINSRADIYIQKSAVEEFYNLKYPEPKYIGMDRRIMSLPGVHFIEGDFRIAEGIDLFTLESIRREIPRGNKLLKIKKENGFVCDDFCHEQYLAIEECGQRVLLSGCAHRGILNIIERYTELFDSCPTDVISGFHTVLQEYTEKDDEQIEEWASCMAKTPTTFYTGHCTSEHPMQIFRKIMKGRLRVFHSGDVIL